MPRSSSTDIDVRVLGPIEAWTSDRTLRVPGGRQLRLFGSLLLAGSRTVSVDRLIDDVWIDEPPEGARAALHTLVARLRRVLGPAGDLVVHRPPGYALAVPAEARDDHRFGAACRRARTLRPEDAVACYDDALALWRGSAWGELADDLARGEALRLEEMRLQAREERAAALLRTGAAADALGDLEILLDENPLRERVVSLTMEAMQQHRSAADALAVFDRHRRLLAEELGLDPSAALTALQQRVLRQELPAGPTAARNHDAPSRRPVDRPVDRPVGPPVDRPVGTATALVGRDDDLATLRALLDRDRLVTVVGPGGVGKTRLVDSLTRYSEAPSWWVDLAASTDASNVDQLIVDALGIDSAPGVALRSALRQRVATLDGVLVLDNCEHLLDAVAPLAAALLDVPSQLRVVATSRERLALEGEQVMALPPLALPAAEVADASAPAVALFLQRALAVDPDLVVDDDVLRRIGSICRALDGLPLAIELAGTRVGTLTIDDLADRLDARLDMLGGGSRTAPDRHRTLRAVVDWSYGLLAAEERDVFLRLSVFAATFDLAAAEEVAASHSVPRARVADVVGRLADRSMLVRPGGTGRGRYRMLETLRQYAHARLTEQELREVRTRHAAWALALAETAGAGVRGPDEAAWVRRLDEAVDDLRSAWQEALATGALSTAARLCVALYEWAMWRMRSDILRWGERLAADDRDVPDLAQVCAIASHSAWTESRLDDAASLAERSLNAANADGSTGCAAAYNALADVALVSGDLMAAAAAYHQAFEMQRKAGQAFETSTMLSNEVLARAYAGEAVTDLVREAVATADATENPTARAFALYVEGEALADRDPDRALAALDEAQRLAAQVGNRFVGGVAMMTGAGVSLRGRVSEPGVDVFQSYCQAVAHWRTNGNRTLLLTTLRNLVPLLTRAGEDVAAIELAAALEATPGAHATFGEEAERLRAAVHVARQRLSDEESAAAELLGARRSLDAATTAALAALETLAAS